METTNFIVPYGTTEIEERQFADSGYLGDVVIPNTVQSIGKSAFYGCGLASVTIPDSVIVIDDFAFSWLDGKAFSKVNITSLSNWCRIGFGIGSNPLSDAHNLYLNNSLVTDMTIPDDVKIIKDFAFDGCTSLRSVTINSNVSKIELYAFKKCSNLKSVKLANVTNIGRCAFEDCNQLEHIYYQGTKAQWKKISKEPKWDKNTGKYTVHCIDGDIKKSLFG